MAALPQAEAREAIRILRNQTYGFERVFDNQALDVEGLVRRATNDTSVVFGGTSRQAVLADQQRYEALRTPLLARREALRQARTDPRVYGLESRQALARYNAELQQAIQSLRGVVTQMRTSVNNLKRQSLRERTRTQQEVVVIGNPQPPMEGPETTLEQRQNRRFQLYRYTFRNNLAFTGQRVAEVVRYAIQRLPALPDGSDYFIALEGSVSVLQRAVGQEEFRPTIIRFNRRTFSQLYEAEGANPQGLMLTPAMLYGDPARLQERINAYTELFFENILRFFTQRYSDDELYELDEGDEPRVFETLDVVAKALRPAGQGYVRLVETMDGKLYSPERTNACLIDCLMKAYLPEKVRNNVHYFEVYKRIYANTNKWSVAHLERHTYTRRPLKMNQTTHVIKALGIDLAKVRLKFYAFGVDGSLKNVGRPINGGAEHNHLPTTRIIYVHGHYVLFTGTSKELSKVKPEFFQPIEATEDEDLLDLASGLECSKRIELDGVKEHPYRAKASTCFFDFETLGATKLERERYKQGVYASGWTTLGDHYEPWIDPKTAEPSLFYVDLRHPKPKVSGQSTEHLVEVRFGMTRTETGELDAEPLKQFADFLLRKALHAQDKVLSFLKQKHKIDPIRDSTDPFKVHFENAKDYKKYINFITFNRERQIDVYGFNNGKFDNYLLLEELKNYVCGDIPNTAHGLLMASLFDGLVQLKDIRPHTGSSLDKACKSFKVECGKTDLPHDWVSFERLHYVGDPPPAEYWKDQTLPEEHRDKVFDFQQVATDYQRRDVFATMSLYTAYALEMIDLVKFNPFNHLTISSLAWSHLAPVLAKRNVKVAQSLKVDKFIRKAIRGGRTTITKAYFCSSFKQALHDAQDDPVALLEVVKAMMEAKDYIIPLDANSLYPSAMVKYEYPVGDHRVVTPEDHARLMDALHATTYAHHAILDVSIDYPTPRGVYFPVVPLLPTQATKEEFGTSNRFTLEARREVLSSVDLMEMVKYNGARIVKIHQGLEWLEKADIFSDTISPMYNKRDEAKKNGDEAKQNAIKLLLNSIYGKTLEHLHETKRQVFNDTEKEKNDLDLLFHTNQYLAHVDYDERVVVEYTKPLCDDDVKRPCHLGVFILAYAKKLMNEVVEAIDGFDDEFNTPFYQDTDSLYIHAKWIEPLVRQGFVGTELCKFKPDLKDVKETPVGKGVFYGAIYEAIFVAPKLYGYDWVGYTKKGLSLHHEAKSKGTKPRTDKETITRDQYFTMLERGGNQSLNVGNQMVMRRQLYGEGGVGIVKEVLTKEINTTWWKGKQRVLHPTYDRVWLPFGL